MLQRGVMITFATCIIGCLTLHLKLYNQMSRWFLVSSTKSSDNDVNGGGDVASTISNEEQDSRVTRSQRRDATLLDLYSGCGAMSTGLCMGAQLAGLKLVTVRLLSC